MPQNSWRKCRTLWEVLYAHDIKNNKERNNSRQFNCGSNLYDERRNTASLSNSLTPRIHFGTAEKCLWWQACCTLLLQPLAVFSFHFYTLLDFLPLSAIAVFSVDDFQWGRKNRPLDSLNSLHSLCPCHLIDRCTLSSLFTLACFQQSYPFIATFITRSRTASFEISTGYSVPNELGGLPWLQEHLPLLSEDTYSHVQGDNRDVRNLKLLSHDLLQKGRHEYLFFFLTLLRISSFISGRMLIM